MAERSGCRLHVCLLGSFLLQINKATLTDESWKSKKALTLFKYLVAKQGEKVPNEVLIELLWPDNEGIDCSHNLHAVVHLARRALRTESTPKSSKESPIRHSNGLYWLQKDDIAFMDIRDFEEHVESSRQLEHEDQAAALSSCEHALKLYRGDFLQEDLYEDWTIPLRERYRDMYVDVSLRAAALLVACRHDHNAALHICRQIVETEPYREEGHQALISALVEAERYSEAITAYKQYADMLRNEFGLEPSSAVQDIVRNMKNSMNSRGRGDSSELDIETPREGAFICDKESFRSIVTLEGRRINRSGKPLGLVAINTEQGSSGCSSHSVLSVAQQCLRRGDAICQWSPGLILVLLSGIEEAGVKIVSKRLDQVLTSNSAGACEVSYQIIGPNDSRQEYPLDSVLP